MHETAWTRLWERFHRAADLAPEAREAWLRSNITDPAERAELDALLAAHARTDATLDRPLSHDPLDVGRSVGGWRLQRELGRGGMGAVWLAEDANGRTAAIKFIAGAFVPAALGTRFRREQRILASLEHPDIARLFDLGISDDGMPWLAMEFVDGLPLDRWWRERAPELRTRIRLVQQLCGAVQHAHQQLVVHRDIKPGNVLVRDDGCPVLLDFGIAKLLTDDSDPDRTGTAMPALLTPRYASPEQLLGAPVGTASDVYSLGVVLYELLCQALPFDSPGESWAAWVAEVTTRSPAPPSARGGSLVLDRELDAIVLMALRKEPSRRYASATAFADDLQRYLDRKPVRARPDALSYRIAKFAQRHRVGVALGSVALAALIGLGVRLAIENDRANAALEVSQRERARAEDTVAFLTGIFREADPTAGDGRELSARDVLERGLALLDARRLDPASRVAVLSTLGEIFVNAGAYARAEALFEQARELAADLGKGERLRADVLHGLGGAQQAAARHAEARITLIDALAQRREAYGMHSVEAADTAERLGATEQSLAHYDAARNAYDDALTIRQSLLPADDPRLADILLRLGSLHWSQGRYDAAEPYYRDALALRRRHPEQVADLARALDAAGALAHVRGRHVEAQAHYEEALALRRRVLGAQHRLTADTLGNLGALAYDRGDAAAAIPLLVDALAAQRIALGKDSPVVAKTLNNLALAYTARGQRSEARRALEHALAINRKAFGEGHQRVAGNLNNLGLVLLDAGEAREAEVHFAQALAILEPLLGGEDPQLGFALTNRARALIELGRGEDAEAILARALALRRRHLDASHPSLAETLTWYGVLRCDSGNAHAGATFLRDALALREQAFGQAHALTSQTSALLAICHLDSKEFDLAAPLLAHLDRVAADPAIGEPLRRRVARYRDASL
jgi:tetratricopeptide (TPR) repeat protein